MFRCLVACGTEPTPGARAQEAARLVSQFIGDMCVVALASEDRRSFGPFAVESRDPRMTEAMRQAVEASDRERAAWPLAGRALISGEPVVIDRIRPGELEDRRHAPRDALSAVMVIDIDGFEYVNDSVGHQAGDELIRAVARTLAGRLRVSELSRGSRSTTSGRGSARSPRCASCRSTTSRSTASSSPGSPGARSTARSSGRSCSLARAVGRRTIAELVPDEETLELLGELGVDLAQGFHIGRPRPLEELRDETWIPARHRRPAPALPRVLRVAGLDQGRRRPAGQRAARLGEPDAVVCGALHAACRGHVLRAGVGRLPGRGVTRPTTPTARRCPTRCGDQWERAPGALRGARLAGDEPRRARGRRPDALALRGRGRGGRDGATSSPATATCSSAPPTTCTC